MQVKKYEFANLERRKGAYFSVGLLFVLAIILSLFEYRSFEKEQMVLNDLELNIIEEEIIPISQITPPPPPPPPQPTTQIQIVADSEEIEEELEMDDMEIDDDTFIEAVPYEETEMPEEEFVEEEIFTIVEQMPSFPGGIDKMFKYLGENIKYPELAKDARIEGKVYIAFVVNKKGEIDEIEVLRGIGGGCDEEAIRVVSTMPNWTPGKQRGKAVKVRYNLPINFILK